MEGPGVELEYGEVGKLVAVGIEEFVIENTPWLAGQWLLSEHPFLLGMQVGLRGPALDLVAQRLLLAVGLGQIVLVEQKQHHRQHRGHGHNRNDQPVQADPRGLDGDNLAVAVHHAEGDQRRNQHRQRRNVVEHAGRQVQQVRAHDGKRNVVAQNVAYQVEEGEDDHQKHKSGQHQSEHAGEFAQDVLVQDTRENDARKNAARPGSVRARLQPAEKLGEVEPVALGRNLELRQS